MRHVLVVIDVQNDFVSGSLGIHDPEVYIDTLEAYLKKNTFDSIYYTMDTHDQDYMHSMEGAYLPVCHCEKYSEGWLLEKRIEPYLKSAKKIEKTTFGSLDLANAIKENEEGLYDITVVGLVSDICVISNCVILKTVLPNVRVRVIESCCQGTTNEAHTSAMVVLNSLQVEVVYD